MVQPKYVPEPGDKGMVDSPTPAPKMNSLGRAVCTQVLDRLGSPEDRIYKVSPDNQTIIISTLVDFVAAMRILAKEADRPVVNMALVSQGTGSRFDDDLVFPFTVGAQRINLSLRQDAVLEMLRVPGVTQQGKIVTWDTRVQFDIQDHLRRMAQREQEAESSRKAGKRRK
jgi:hypothetical protein